MAALANNLTIYEGRIDAAPDLVLVDDGEKYAITTSNLRDLFTADGGLARVVNAIDDMVRANPYDLTAVTAKGRSNIKSLAHKITRSKTFLDGIGKDMVAELKDLPRRVDANRKTMRDQLDSLAEDIRRPLTEYEARTKALSDRLNWLDALPTTMATETADVIRVTINRILDMPMTEEAWNGFHSEAVAIHGLVTLLLEKILANRETEESQAAELAQLREQAAERERKDAEAQRLADAQERGRREAEQRAESERQAALGREAEAWRQATLAQQQAEESERRRVESEARAAQATIDARLRAEEAGERAAIQAVEAEQERQAAAARKEAEEKAAREANKEDSRKINSEALEGIVQAIVGANTSLDADQITAVARAVTVAIIKGEVRHARIEY